MVNWEKRKALLIDKEARWMLTWPKDTAKVSKPLRLKRGQQSLLKRSQQQRRRDRRTRLERHNLDIQLLDKRELKQDLPLHEDAQRGKQFWDDLFKDLEENYDEEEQKQFMDELAKKMVFVRHVPKERALDTCLELFSAHGKVMAVSIGSTPSTYGTAHIVMESRKSVISAIRHLNGLQVAGRTLLVGTTSRKQLEGYGNEDYQARAWRKDGDGRDKPPEGHASALYDKDRSKQGQPGSHRYRRDDSYSD
ncbi:hypothetical protein GUITHDRAFT_110456 [Guillardia theta CCMP2712]|uniref:RRM domain-containing protein n=1 Tax=Guillardia theta (strain CCMP2712) TaxID=905079 RepID=L1J5N5_GUITC|nr:hypothetical protein GUITHDRAFT_110456 [Guillardia theta CCMP2712]EKX43657.1 hypothetical protein GUITHDRAFT_110456 [Guillardia theta CCMP2712]|eukprot:XP_005830637.1 hypothetical protein GUITHDRAFT_110456 [Guillardia theta CCMP2712]